MMKNIFAALIFLSALSFAQKATVETANYDFGNITQGETVSYEYKITNNGKAPLVIEKVKASCGCTAAEPDKNELAPGESTIIKVSFNSTGRSGKQNKNVFVYTNDPNAKELKLSFAGNIVEQGKDDKKIEQAKIDFKESQHDFGVVKEGKVVDYTFKFKNAGGTELEIKDVKTSCGCTAALLSSKKIKPGKEGTIRVELDTKNRSGRISRNITVMTNDPNEPNKILTIYADIQKES